MKKRNKAHASLLAYLMLLLIVGVEAQIARGASVYGADPEGVKDSAAAVSAGWRGTKYDSRRGNVAGTLTLPCGTYKLATTVLLDNAYMGMLQGEGGCVQFVWAGNSTTPMFLIRDCFRCDFGNFRIVVNSSHPLLYAIQTESSGIRGGIGTADHFHNIEIEGSGHLFTGIEINGPFDGNNDQQIFRDVSVYGYTHSGWTLGSEKSGFNIFDVVMEHCGFSGNGAPYGVETLHGNFHWLNGDGGGNSIADFYFATLGAGGYDIVGGHFEASAAFIATAGPSGFSAVVRVENITWGGECVGNTAASIRSGCPGGPAGGKAIDWNFLGPLVVKSSQFGEIDPSNLTMNIGQSGGVIEDCNFRTTNTTAATLMPGGVAERFLNNRYVDKAGIVHVYAPQTLAPGSTANLPNASSAASSEHIQLTGPANRSGSEGFLIKVVTDSTASCPEGHQLTGAALSGGYLSAAGTITITLSGKCN